MQVVADQNHRQLI